MEDPLLLNPGETLTLKCVVVGGDPYPVLSWVKSGDVELPVRSLVEAGILTIPAVTVDDSGVYTCVAANNVGNTAKKSTTVLVRGEN